MDSDAGRPAGAADRERVTGVLRERMASGRLSLADYQARLRRVKSAATVGDLDAVLRDLPGRTEADADAPAGPGTAGAPPDAGEAGGPETGRTPRGGGCGGAAMLVFAVLAVLLLLR